MLYGFRIYLIFPFLVSATANHDHLLITICSLMMMMMIRFIRPEDVPIQYGGLSRPSDGLNGPPKPASDFTVKGGERVNIQIEGIEVKQLA